jgi:hypothetical protein
MHQTPTIGPDFHTSMGCVGLVGLTLTFGLGQNLGQFPLVLHATFNFTPSCITDDTANLNLCTYIILHICSLKYRTDYK